MCRRRPPYPLLHILHHILPYTVASTNIEFSLVYSLSHDEDAGKYSEYGSVRTIDTKFSESSSITASFSESEGGPQEEFIAVVPIEEYEQEDDDLHGEKFIRYEEGGAVTKEDTPSVSFDSWVESFKYLYSAGLLIFSIVAVMAVIFTKQTVATDAGVPTLGAFVIFWFLIIWLAKMEGGQACLVGLQPIDKELYAQSHPVSLVSTAAAHKGNNMERFIVGRQFLVLLVVFATNLMASTIEGASVLSLSDSMMQSFLGSGVAVTLIAIMIGQSAQINAANCMLDFINNHFMVFTTYSSLILDMSGILHSVYLFQIFFARITNSPVESKEPPRTNVQNLFFWARVFFSTATLIFAAVATISALMDEQTTMYAGVPPMVSILLLLFLLCFVGVMEGMQIALFAVVNFPSEELKMYPFAAKCCELSFRGSNLQAFLIGRQMLVTFCQFIIARITSCNIQFGEDTVFGVSYSIQKVFNSGVLGAILTTIVGSLAWRIIASSFAITFLSNHLMYAIIRLCLLVEGTGVCSVAWLLADIQKKMIFHYKLDTVYLATTKENTNTTVVEKNDYVDLEKQHLIQRIEANV